MEEADLIRVSKELKRTETRSWLRPPGLSREQNLVSKMRRPDGRGPKISDQDFGLFPRQS
jgi:hypothetical protein